MIGLLGMLILVGVCVLLGWERSPKPTKRISLEASGNDPVSLPPQADKLRIAVGAIISPAKSLIFYEDIFDYIGEKLGQEVEMVQRKTYSDVNIHMEEGRIDAAFVCSRPYVRGHRDFGMELLCVPVCLGETVYHSYFIVHKDSPIQKLEGLRGKVFAFSDPLSNRQEPIRALPDDRKYLRVVCGLVRGGCISTLRTRGLAGTGERAEPCSSRRAMAIRYTSLPENRIPQDQRLASRHSAVRLPMRQESLSPGRGRAFPPGNSHL